MKQSARGLGGRLPNRVTPALRRLSVASLIGQSVLIVSGGAVRLTASGLGCPTWPRCTAGSLVNTPEMGIHGVIEFGNRTLTFALALVAALMLVFLWNLRKERKDLFWLSFGLLASIPVQAVIGGISVLTQLNPWVVGLHFLVSAALVAFSMLLVNRTYDRTGAAAPVHRHRPSKTIRQLSVVVAACTALAVVLGVMVTGSGPHAGDANAPRNELNPDLITRFHVLPVYVLVISSVILLILLWRRGSNDALRAGAVLLMAAVLFQGAIGYAQHFTGLPPILVGLHMLGAAALLAAATNFTDLALSRRRR
ncbi:COX15/CtaA family protein [Paenarthrobacter sp. PH39-S1]|uniref:COX15/CtaA family protein n=1 Tax=Paenarthrobacter sp. PH39-S1 TaxID=3046204 RepID=UPI0024BA1C87|nr:COX15/CtaA family protein [Paenarthrobacter sp. PH39-S1]MDJ0357830.1 COX15/CtaA family protein [Paenarthrobacter sp. PH39-S1]